MAHEFPPPQHPKKALQPHIDGTNLKASYFWTGLVLLAALLGLTPSNALAAAGVVDSLNLALQPSNGVVNATAVQLDGKIIIAGSFTNVLGVARRNLARLNGDGTLDTTFTNGADLRIYSVALDNRRIVIAGTFGRIVNPSGGTVATRQGLASLNYDSTVDTSVRDNLLNDANVVVLQADGTMLVGGTFPGYLVRLGTNGAIDPSFAPSPNAEVKTVVAQPDGKILIGGSFTNLQPIGAASPTARSRIARLESNGDLDTTFNASADSVVNTIALDPIGYIFVGGDFNVLVGTSGGGGYRRFGRLDLDGEASSFTSPNPNAAVDSLAFQSDGKIIFGGKFTTARGTNRNHIARLNLDGTLDSAFDPQTDGEVKAVAMQADGSILVCGQFTNAISAGGGPSTARGLFARLSNDGSAQGLGIVDNTQVTWFRSGALPEVSDVGLEFTTDGGLNWINAGGLVTRANGDDLRFTETAIPSSATLRAYGKTIGGLANGTFGNVGISTNYSGLPAPVMAITGNGMTITNGDAIPSSADGTAFGSVTTAGPGTVVRTFTITNSGTGLLNLTGIGIVHVTDSSDPPFSITAPPASSIPPGGSTTFEVTFAPQLSAIGSFVAYVYFKNNFNLTNVFYINGTGLNSVPTVTSPIPDQYATPGTPFTYTFPLNAFNDADFYNGNVLTYSAFGLPSWLSFARLTRTFSGTPTSTNLGFADIQVFAQDSNFGRGTNIFRMTVAPLNHAPTLANPIPDQGTLEDSPFSFTFPTNTFADVDAGTLFTYSATNLPAWLTFTPATRNFSGTPANANVGFFDITVIATDNGTPAMSVSDLFRLTVTNVNDAPTATNLSAPETYTEDTPLNLIDIVISDVDSATVTATLTLSPAAAGSLSTGTSGAVTSTYNAATGLWTASGAIANVNALLAGVIFNPATNYNANFTIATSVSDGVAPAITGSKAMTGVAVNDPPTATNLSAPETYTEDTPLNLTDIVISDVDSATVTATLTLSTVAAGSLSTASSGAVTSTYNAATGVWTASGAIANVNTLLAGVTFRPATNYNASFTIDTSVSDGVAPAIIGSKAMAGTAVNDPPTATTLPATDILNTSATLNGTINADGLVAQAYFRYGLTTNYGSFSATNTVNPTNIAVAVSNLVSGLSPLTTYHFRLVASNIVGVASGADLAFTTVAAPSLTAVASAIIATNGASGLRTVQLSALVNPNGLSTTVKFQYGATAAYGLTSIPPSLPAAFTASNVTTTIDVSPGFTWHWRAVVTNNLGTATSLDQTFTLAPPGGAGLAGDLNGDGVVSQAELNAVYANYVTNSPWLYMTNVAGLGGTNVSFALDNSISGGYTVEFSTNLPNWFPLGPATPRYVFTDTNAPAQPQRYYRLRCKGFD